tara:strand:+ start:1237 stop:1416 length:180 start_codon:yes stop_codon:yes gene_type:complete
VLVARLRGVKTFAKRRERWINDALVAFRASARGIAKTRLTAFVTMEIFEIVVRSVSFSR